MRKTIVKIINDAKNEKILKEIKGVTLVALVITIIVLLILAGVSSATLIGENGILTRANEAKIETEDAEKEELRNLTMLEAATNLENTTYTDKNNVTVTIPSGFAVSQVEGESTIEDGLVIIDKNGNEFVWIPVPEYTEFIRRDGYLNGNTDDIINYGEADETGNIANIEFEEQQTTKDEAKAMYESVKNNKGFYIGRYEAGIESDEPRKNGDLTKDEAVVKKNKNVYNYIGWSLADNMSSELGGAIELSRNFAKNQGYDQTKVHSTLCYSVQWDTALNFIDPGYTGYAKDSTGKGNYTGELLKTGSNEEYKVKNIYDMAGNVYERTMELDGTCRVSRGGNYAQTGFSYPASSRRASSPNYGVYGDRFGFRIALYL